MGTVGKKQIGIFIAAVAALLLLFSFLDLPISMAIFNMESKFGIFFAAFGEWPYSIIGVFSASAMLATRSRDVKWKNIVGFIVYGLIGLLMTMMVGFMPTNYIKGLPIALTMVLALAIFAGSLFASHKIAKKHPVELRRAAVIGLFTILAATVVINVIKQFWGRPRMRIMQNPASEFTPWYLPQGIAASDEFKSFPSGHSANAATALCITLLPTFLHKLRGKEPILYAAALILTVLVMVSRVIMGAHFASDVTMGVSLSIACFFTVKHLVGRYFAKRHPSALGKAA